MNFQHYLYRALTLPPHITIRKAVRKARQLWTERSKRQRDLIASTYVKAKAVPSGELRTYLDGIRIDGPIVGNLVQMFTTKQYLSHRFDLLGSGWVQVKHGVSCSGVEGHRYTEGLPVQVDLNGQWLRERINHANLKESCLIWSLVDEKYCPIDWQLDFKSGYRWTEKVWYRDIQGGHFGLIPGADVKVPWELTRMQHLPQLAIVAGFARNRGSELQSPEIYAREFRNQVLDFIATNPPRFGVNWCCTMDVAIRVANWLMAYDLFRAAGLRFDSEFELEFLRSVYQHGYHIYTNLEWDPELAGNHYLADIVGLLFVAAYLPQTPQTDLWLAFAVQELIKEVGRQFTEDGANFEASTVYHRLCAEMVVYATALVLALEREKRAVLASYDTALHYIQPQLNPPPIPFYQSTDGNESTPFPDWYVERLERMAQFTKDITKPDGRIPQFGDCDNGRFMKLHPMYVLAGAELMKVRSATEGGKPDCGGVDRLDLQEDHLDHTHLLSAFGGLLDLPDSEGNHIPEYVDFYVIRHLARGIRFTSRRGPAPAVAEMWAEESKQFAEPPTVSTDLQKGLRVLAYQNFGLFVYKSSRLYLAVRCGRGDINGIGNHAHNDNLSFELVFDGMPIVIDPGTYVYTPAPSWRNRFRSSAMHNTLVVAGMEQNSWREGREGLFQLRDRSNPRVVEYSLTCFVGEHSGFGAPHRRELLITPNGVHGRDRCEVNGVKQVFFHFPSSSKASLIHNGTCVKLDNEGRTVTLHSPMGEWSLVHSFRSDGYGSQRPAQTAQLVTDGSLIEWTIEL